MGQLDGKVAIITGAGGGIGSATAKLMAERGARLALADIRLDWAERVSEEIRAAGGEAISIRLDLGNPADVKAMIDTTVSTYGRLDVLVNVAAELSPDLAPRDIDIETMELDVWDRTFNVNVRGTMLACKHAVVAMLADGGGSIVNIASNLGLQGNVIQLAYSTSKAAILQMTRSIAASHGKKGIRCNAVSPGLTLTDKVRDVLPAVIREVVESETLTPYLGVPMDMAYAIAYLASDEARYVTGHNLVVDGGTATHVPGVSGLRGAFGG